MKKQQKRRIRWNRVGLLLVMLMIMMSFAVNALADAATVNCTGVTVEGGDTLWSLIKEYNPDYNGDMNEAVYRTCRLNDMSTSKICVGQNVLIPKL